MVCLSFALTKLGRSAFRVVVRSQLPFGVADLRLAQEVCSLPHTVDCCSIV